MALHFAGHIAVQLQRIVRVALIGVVLRSSPRRPPCRSPAATTRQSASGRSSASTSRSHGATAMIGERQRERRTRPKALEGRVAAVEALLEALKQHRAPRGVELPERRDGLPPGRDGDVVLAAPLAQVVECAELGLHAMVALEPARVGRGHGRSPERLRSGNTKQIFTALRVCQAPGGRAHLPRLRLPVPPHRRRRRALVPAPRRAAGGDGHEVTYLTLRQWEHGEHPGVEGVRVVAVGPRMRLYGSTGNAEWCLRWSSGVGVLWHLLRRGGRYDVVHTASFPYFSCSRRPWLAFCTASGWWSTGTRSGRATIGGVPGPLAGRVGLRCSARCIRIRQHAFCFSQLNLEQLRPRACAGSPTAARPVRGDADCRRASQRRAGGAVRRAAHPGEARPALVPAAGAGPCAGARTASG